MKVIVKEASLPLNKNASSFYIVHANSGGRHMGQIVMNYTDGTHQTIYIDSGVNVAGWWYPEGNARGNIKLAASVTNAKSLSVGAYVYGFNNPHPDKILEDIRFIGSEAPGKWIILALTAVTTRYTILQVLFHMVLLITGERQPWSMLWWKDWPG